MNNHASSIKFGSYDTSGIAPGFTLQVYRTRSLQTWEVNGRNFKVNKKDISSPGSKLLNFDMSLPYIYLPD